MDDSDEFIDQHGFIKRVWTNHRSHPTQLPKNFEEEYPVALGIIVLVGAIALFLFCRWMCSPHEDPEVLPNTEPMPPQPEVTIPVISAAALPATPTTDGKNVSRAMPQSDQRQRQAPQSPSYLASDQLMRSLEQVISHWPSAPPTPESEQRPTSGPRAGLDLPPSYWRAASSSPVVRRPSQVNPRMRPAAEDQPPSYEEALRMNAYYSSPSLL